MEGFGSLFFGQISLRHLKFFVKIIQKTILDYIKLERFYLSLFYQLNISCGLQVKSKITCSSKLIGLGLEHGDTALIQFRMF